MDDTASILRWPFRKFQEFARSNAWHDLPFRIQLAMDHLWRAEQDVAREDAPRKKR